MAVSKALRFQILRRDNHACRYCGKSAPEVVLHVDHVIPVALGGSDQADNLVTACRDCNSGKSSSSPDAAIVADVSEDALRWSRALEQVAAQAQADRDRQLRVSDAWVEYWDDHAPYFAELPVDYAGTIAKFNGLGLTLEDMIEAAGSALGAYGVSQRNRFRYFCGVCWGIVRDRQAAAAAIIEAGGGD